MSTFDEKRAILAESLKLLVTHEPFQRFMDEIGSMRENAIVDACNDQVIGDANKMAAALGEVRCYTDIRALVNEYRKSIDTEPD